MQDVISSRDRHEPERAATLKFSSPETETNADILVDFDSAGGFDMHVFASPELVASQHPLDQLQTAESFFQSTSLRFCFLIWDGGRQSAQMALSRESIGGGFHRGGDSTPTSTPGGIIRRPRMR